MFINAEDHPRHTLGATLVEHHDADTAESEETRPLPVLLVGGDTPFPQPNRDLELGESIGVGGMGQVHVANQLTMDRPVAIKRSHHPAGNGPSFGSVVAEGRRFGRLDHPNIPPVHLIGRDEQHRAVLVMKRIEGSNWRSMLEDPHHPRWSDVSDTRLARNLGILIQVCHAVEHAHSRGLLHRDIKTDNIMIGDFGQVYLIDWGISVDLNDPAQQKTTTNFVGTPCFAAPEMAVAGSQLTRTIDVYLLGGTLYDVLTGTVPRQESSIPEVLKNIAKPLELKFTADTPAALADICRKALAHDPDDRYPSAARFREAIEQFLRHRFFLEQLETARSTLNEMRDMTTNNLLDIDSSARMMNISHKCRFALESVIENGVAVEVATKMLVECLALQIGYTIASRELRVARILMNQLQQIVGSDAPIVVQLSDQIAHALQARSTRELELSVQIQTKLLESIQSMSGAPESNTEE